MTGYQVRLHTVGMALRTGSIGAALDRLDPEIRRALLEDYQTAHRRDHCSRTDFADGWLALLRRIQGDPSLKKSITVRNT